MDDKHCCKVRVVANRACETRGLQTSLAGMTTRSTKASRVAATRCHHFHSLARPALALTHLHLLPSLVPSIYLLQTPVGPRSVGRSHFSRNRHCR